MAPARRARRLPDEYHPIEASTISPAGSATIPRHGISVSSAIRSQHVATLDGSDPHESIPIVVVCGNLRIAAAAGSPRRSPVAVSREMTQQRAYVAQVAVKRHGIGCGEQRRNPQRRVVGGDDGGGASGIGESSTVT